MAEAEAVIQITHGKIQAQMGGSEVAVMAAITQVTTQPIQIPTQILGFRQRLDKSIPAVVVVVVGLGGEVIFRLPMADQVL